MSAIVCYHTHVFRSTNAVLFAINWPGMQTDFLWHKVRSLAGEQKVQSMTKAKVKRNRYVAHSMYEEFHETFKQRASPANKFLNYFIGFMHSVNIEYRRSCWAETELCRWKFHFTDNLLRSRIKRGSFLCLKWVSSVMLPESRLQAPRNSLLRKRGVDNTCRLIQ